MVTAIIQARMGSTRLQGKVLKKVLGKTMLEYQIERVKRAKTINQIILATTTNSENKKIIQLAQKLKVRAFAGSENDVLDRYYQAATRFGIDDVIVRLTGDCPLTDPNIIDRVVRFYLKNKKSCQYANNVDPPTFPDGMDVEVFSFNILKEAWQKADLLSEREHVTPYIRNHPEKFKIKNLKSRKDLSRPRLVLDNKEDFILIGKIFTALYPKNKNFDLEDILEFLKKNSKLILINSHIQRNEGMLKSLRIDRKINRSF
ncbi:MAG: glycosyltransferase family protein [bacterium]|nr:glycosyltransferase family protein [bacterium]